MDHLQSDPIETVNMTFRIKCEEPITITYTNLTTQTIADLKLVVSQHYQLPHIELLDLGRLMRNNELLITQPRTEYTIYIPKN